MYMQTNHSMKLHTNLMEDIYLENQIKRSTQKMWILMVIRFMESGVKLKRLRSKNNKIGD